MNNKRSITLSDGKYEFYEHNHIVRCDRYGERWREFIGDKAIRALFDHATEQAEQIKDLMATATEWAQQVEEQKAQNQRLKEALEQALLYVESDEVSHGRQFGTGNAIRQALKGQDDVRNRTD